MTDYRLLNGGQKCTVIERFDSKVLILCNGKRQEFDSLVEAKKYISKNGLKVNIEFLFGSSIQREIQKGECP